MAPEITPRGSHRPVRAEFPHTVPQVTRFASQTTSRRHEPFIRYPLALRRHYARVRCLPGVPRQRRGCSTPRFLPPGPRWVEVPGFCGTIEALRLPVAHPAALRFPSFGGTTGSRMFRSRRRCVRQRRTWSWSPGTSGRELSWKRQDLPCSWGTPIVLSPCSPTPLRTSAADKALRQGRRRGIHERKDPAHPVEEEDRREGHEKDRGSAGRAIAYSPAAPGQACEVPRGERRGALEREKHELIAGQSQRRNRKHDFMKKPADEKYIENGADWVAPAAGRLVDVAVEPVVDPEVVPCARTPQASARDRHCE